MGRKKINLSIVAISVALLSGCGGGSSSSSSDDSMDLYNICAKSDSDIDKPTLYCATDCQSDVVVGYSGGDKDECEAEASEWLDSFTHSDVTATQEQQDAIDWLNVKREAMGLAKFHSNEKLEQATLNHENYLNDVWYKYSVNMTHYEDNENYPSDYYTGYSGVDRAEYTGYDGYGVGEVISYMNNDIQSSIDGLLTAIYHRLALFARGTNQIGIGGTQHNFAYPHLMGYNGDRYDYLLAMSNDIVTYPYANQDDFQTTFIVHNESPDPMPNADEDMGNPISISFNGGDIELVSFKVYDSNNNELDSYDALTSDNDDSGFIDDRTFVLFTKVPYESNSTYNVVFKYKRDGKDNELKWSFKTRDEE